MAQGKVGRVLMLPVLVVDLVVYLIILGLASWSLNKYIDGQQNNPRKFNFFIIFYFQIKFNILKWIL